MGGAKVVMGEGKEINLGEDVVCNEIFITFVAKWWQEASTRKKISTGVLAHLARARHWQCRGERFESAILHMR